MSEAIKKLLGDELYNQVLEKSGLKSSEFDLLKNYIPKSRFNEVFSSQANAASSSSPAESFTLCPTISSPVL